MPTEFELTSWLKSLGLGDESVKNVVTAMGADAEKVAPTIKSQVMAQSDYSRKMDELRTKEDTLRQEYLTKTEAELTALAGARSEFDTRYQAALKERVEAENRLALMRAEIDRVASEYAIPDDALKTIRTGATAAVKTDPPAKTEPTFDASKLMSKEEFGREAFAYKRLPLEYQRIAAEHQALFGTNPFLGDPTTGVCVMDKVLERAEKGANGKQIPLRTAWEQEFNVGAKRAEVAEANKQAEIKAAVAAAEQRVRSELALQGAPVVDPTLKFPHSPVFAPRVGPDGKPIAAPVPVAGQPQFQRATAGSHEDRVAAATAAFSENYRKASEGVVQ